MAKKKLVRRKPTAKKAAKKAEKKPPKKAAKKAPAKKPPKKAAKKAPAKKAPLKRSRELAVYASKLQQSGFDDMPKAWRDKAAEAILIHKNAAQSVVLARHNLGTIVADMLADETTFGVKSVPKLAQALGKDVKAKDLYICHELAKAYSREKIESLIERSNEAGLMLTATHLRHLASIAGPGSSQVRQQLERKMLEDKLSTTQLLALVETKRRTSSSDGRGGRAPMPPRDVVSGLVQIRKQCESYYNRFDGWHAVVLQGLSDEEIYNEDLVERLIETKKAQETLLEKAMAVRDACDEAIGRAAEAAENTVDAVVGDEEAEDEEYEDEEYEDEEDEEADGEEAEDEEYEGEEAEDEEYEDEGEEYEDEGEEYEDEGEDEEYEDEDEEAEDEEADGEEDEYVDYDETEEV